MGENIGNINQRHFVMLCEVVRWVLPLGRRMGWTIILLHCCLPGVRWVLLLIVKRTLSGKRGGHHHPSMDLYSEGWLSEELKLDRHMSGLADPLKKLTNSILHESADTNFQS